MSLDLEQLQQIPAKEEIIQPFIKTYDQSAIKYKQKLSIEESLDHMFPEQKRQDKDVTKTKEVLGELANSFTELEIKDITTDIDFLVENWLDDFERNIFGNKTLKELLHEKGGL